MTRSSPRCSWCSTACIAPATSIKTLSTMTLEADLPELLGQILRDGPEVGVHTFMWFETLAGISRRLPSSATREVSWRLAGKMSADDSSSFIGVDGASSLREQQLLAANEDRGVLQRCTTIAAPPPDWIQGLLAQVAPKEPIQ